MLMEKETLSLKNLALIGIVVIIALLFTDGVIRSMNRSRLYSSPYNGGNGGNGGYTPPQMYSSPAQPAVAQTTAPAPNPAPAYYPSTIATETPSSFSQDDGGFGT